MPMSAMFMGSPENLLYDRFIKNKFRTEFNTKMGRRSFFIFVNEDIPKREFKTIKECITYDKDREDKAKKYREELLDKLNNVALHNLKELNKSITIDEDVRELCLLYTRYNEELASKIDVGFQISKLSRTHMHWKTLKLAGALALLDCSDSIKLCHYKTAIEYAESVSLDIENFEKELVKEPYELLSAYVKSIAENGKCNLSLHILRKLGYIQQKTNITSAVKELVQLVSSYDKEGIYTVTTDGISYKKIIKNSNFGVSFKLLDGINKEDRVKQCHNNFEYSLIPFNKLCNILTNDTVYSPFKFKDGKRNSENIEDVCNWLVFDVDKSLVTDKELHDQLSDINHFICRTSDPNNEYKFRLVIELDTDVDIPNNLWKLFLSTVSEYLSINVDLLPKSQIYFGYKNSSNSLLSTTDAEPLEIKSLVESTLNSTSDILVSKKLTKTKMNSLLQDREVTFHNAYYAKDREGSRKLIWAAKYAKDLGASKDYTIDLINDINNSWYSPMPKQRLQSTILNQINRWIFD